jgi:hypothetical protein
MGPKKLPDFPEIEFRSIWDEMDDNLVEIRAKVAEMSFEEVVKYQAAILEVAGKIELLNNAIK